MMGQLRPAEIDRATCSVTEMSRFILLGAIFLLPSLAAAQQASDVPIRFEEQVVVTAHAEEAAFETLARAVVVLTREEIARLPAESVAEVLGYASSVDVRSRGPDGVQSDFAIRGSTFGQALVLVDGVRLNDAQTGHHNSDIPVPLDEIERIEVLLGSGSSLYGADAFGGTINVITRRTGSYRQMSVTAGAFGFASAHAAVAGARGGVRESLAVSTDRSGGFAIGRDFRTLNVSSQTTSANGTRLWVSHLRKAFGAAGFYGPALSSERTNQTLVSLDGRTPQIGPWSGRWQTSYRTHGDEFLYDSTRSGPPNDHRTHAVQSTARLQRAASDRGRVTVGAEIGADRIRSSSMGDHGLLRGSVFGELQQRFGGSTVVYPGLRVDGYSTFGAAWSPSLAATTWLGRRVKLRASAGRAFRVPTFTERFYIDPNNLGTPTLMPEHAWSSDASVDWLAVGGWTTGASVFERRARGTIDFVRLSPLEKWQAANIRQVVTHGVELNVRRAFAGSSVVSAQYAFLDAATDALPLLSKYVLEYARHTVTLSASAILPAGFSLGHRIDYKRRRDGSDVWLVDARLGRRFGKAIAFAEGSNLLNARYQEISGVDMPGRWLRVGLRLGGRD